MKQEKRNFSQRRTIKMVKGLETKTNKGQFKGVDMFSSHKTKQRWAIIAAFIYVKGLSQI